MHKIKKCDVKKMNKKVINYRYIICTIFIPIFIPFTCTLREMFCISNKNFVTDAKIKC